MCEVEGCNRTPVARRMCPVHYGRWRRHGGTEDRTHIRDVRSVDYIVNQDGCWIWQKYLCKGYGRKKIGGRDVLAHRYYYEMHRGPIPDGLPLDHLCRVTACCNPEHMEIVTKNENDRRRSTTKLTHQQVAEIKTCYINGQSQKSLALEYDVTQPHISKIVNQTRWRSP